MLFCPQRPFSGADKAARSPKGNGRRRFCVKNNHRLCRCVIEKLSRRASSEAKKEARAVRHYEKPTRERKSFVSGRRDERRKRETVPCTCARSAPFSGADKAARSPKGNGRRRFCVKNNHRLCRCVIEKLSRRASSEAKKEARAVRHYEKPTRERKSFVSGRRDERRKRETVPCSCARSGHFPARTEPPAPKQGTGGVGFASAFIRRRWRRSPRRGCGSCCAARRNCRTSSRCPPAPASRKCGSGAPFPGRSKG